MLNLSKKTDYALLALSYLTRTGPTKAVNTREIAEQYDIPVELLAKILQQLVKANLLISTAGPTGGYRLSRASNAISIANVIEAVDGIPAIAQCFKTDHNGCDQLDKCTIRKPLGRINNRIFQMLNLISLDEINQEDDNLEEIKFVSLPAQGRHGLEFARSNRDCAQEIL